MKRVYEVTVGGLYNTLYMNAAYEHRDRTMLKSENSVLDDWGDRRAWFRYQRRSKADIYKLDGLTPIFTERARELLLPALPPDVAEYLPIKCEGETLYLVHVLSAIAITELVYNPRRDLHDLRLIPEALPDENVLTRRRNDTILYYCEIDESNGLRALAEKYRFRQLQFQPVWSGTVDQP